VLVLAGGKPPLSLVSAPSDTPEAGYGARWAGPGRLVLIAGHEESFEVLTWDVHDSGLARAGVYDNTGDPLSLVPIAP
jgi:hypothetical protein